MISDNQTFDQFISDHRWAVLTTMRDQEPVNSIVAYAREGDETRCLNARHNVQS